MSGAARFEGCVSPSSSPRKRFESARRVSICKQTVKPGRGAVRASRHWVREPALRSSRAWGRDSGEPGDPECGPARAGGCPEGVRGTHRSTLRCPPLALPSSAWPHRRPPPRNPSLRSSTARAAQRRWNGATAPSSARGAASRWAAAKVSPATATRRSARGSASRPVRKEPVRDGLARVSPTRQRVARDALCPDIRHHER